MRNLSGLVFGAVYLSSLFLRAATPVSAPLLRGRQTISLDGTWQIEEGSMEQVPREYTHEVKVPGLVTLATPPFTEPGPVVSDRKNIKQKDPRRDAYYYRKLFLLPPDIPELAELKIGKAMFGSRAYINGNLVGGHAPSFTPAYFNVRRWLRPGENEIVVRVGADRDAVGPSVPTGFDFEKTRYIPGIFDSVELILSGSPHIESVQVAPDFFKATVRVQLKLFNSGDRREVDVRFVVREAATGNVVAGKTERNLLLQRSGERIVESAIALPGFHPWSPEDPFLYTVQVDTGGDDVEARFGMRSFSFDPRTHRAVLNGKPYFLRGSNITLYRFFEDPECGALPWTTQWVRLLHKRLKEMNWNCVRYCIGFPPELWYRIADEEGVLIQDEFPIWFGGTGWSKWPPELKADELALEYEEWMRERWNHPSVAIWDASNETSSPETGKAVRRVRRLDLSERPWDNSYGEPRIPGDVFESHPYHFYDSHFTLSRLAAEDPTPQGNELKNPGDSPVVINEYGWLWLNRDGSPTTLTMQLYENLLGPESTIEARRSLYARYLAAETEYWRCHRQAAAVMHFTALGYSRPDGQTSDHWQNVARLEWEPEFFKYVRDAFAPVGLMIDDWAGEHQPGETHTFKIVVINDEQNEWSGDVHLQLTTGETVLLSRQKKVRVDGLGTDSIAFEAPLPEQAGSYEVSAALLKNGQRLARSVRLFSIGPAKP